MRHAAIGVVALVFLLPLLGSAPEARAEEPKPPGDASEAERDEALARVKALDERAAALIRQRKMKEAIPLVKDALAIREQVYGPEHAAVATTVNRLALLLKRCGAYARARPLYERALAIREKVLAPDDLALASSLNNLANLLYLQGAYERAGRLCERALVIREKARGPDHKSLAGCLVTLALIRDLQQEGDEARRLCERALAITEKALGPHHPSVARILNNLALMLKKRGVYDEALPLYERVLDIYERALGPDAADVAAALHNLAALREAQGAYETSRALHERALEIRETAFGPEHLDVAASLNGLGGVLYRLGHYDEARRLYERSLRTREKLLGPNHPEVATSLNNVASVLRRQGDFGAARALLERALKISRKRLGPDHLYVAISLQNLAGLLEVQAAYGEARLLYEQALAIHERSHGLDRPEAAMCLECLAATWAAEGAFDEARPLYEKSLAIRERLLGPEHPDVGSGLNSLALLLQDQGLFEEARPLHARALAIFEKALGPDHPTVADVLSNLALLLMRQGSYRAAKPLFEQSLAVKEKALGSSHPSVARTLHNLAGVLKAAGAYEEARPLYERSLRIREDALGADHPEVARSLNGLARLLRTQGRYAQARPLYERALAIREAAWGPDHSQVATSLNNLALLCKAEGALEEALPLYERSLAIRRKAFGPHHVWVARGLNNLAMLLSALGRHEAAGLRFAECLDILEGAVRRRFLGLQTTDRHRLVGSIRFNLDNWLERAPTVGRTGYEEVLRFKGLVARATAAERRLIRRGDADLTERVAGLRAANQRQSRLAHAMPPLFDKHKHTAWKQAYAEAGAASEKLALEFAAELAAMRVGMERLDLGLEDIQAHLGADEVLVDLLRVSDRYLAWIVPPHGAVKRIDLGDAGAIEEAASAFAEWAAASKTTRGTQGGPREGKTLHDLVLAPAATYLDDTVRTLLLCPDAALAAVPFAALPGRRAGHSLIDDVSIVQVTLARDLVPREDAAPPGQGALAVGDVDFESAAERGEEPFEPRQTGIAALDRAPRGRRFVALPETRAEVAFVKSRLGAGCATLLGADATESRFRAESRGRRILHLATHGFVRDDLMRGLRRRRLEDAERFDAELERQLVVGHDPMNLAGLGLAGANARTGGHGDDGILTALEVSHLDLDGVELVVLSACETALGKAESGEGVLGLVRGFQMAGARCVIASLWPVDDEATRLLMQHLYDAMLRAENPLPPAEALREAARKVRGSTGKDGRSFAAPRFWASFVAYGR